MSSSSVMSPIRLGSRRDSLFWVRVPVLSEHRMVMPANSSMADRRATITLRWARRREPTAMVDVHTTCMAMGMDATSSTITTDRAPKMVWELVSSAVTRRSMKMMAHSTREMNSSARVILNRIFWKRPWVSSMFSRSAALPKKVLAPVAHTTALSSPRFTAEPIFTLPPGWMFTGRDSPVRAAWSTCSGSPGPSRMASAGMTSPMTSSIRSPGTRVVASPSRHWPPRHTRQEGRREFFRAAMALPAFFSSMKPTIPFTNCRMASTTKSSQSWLMASTMMASQIMMGIGPQK
mmetsp:Transcript_39805/g.81422  ORF Transcript_39805/g.81422 Transcript_39805/m.81422 type:complete len:291 (+) Transcript_39805:1151-2023(+)